MFEALGRSWNLTKESYSVLVKDKELMLFPVISSILTIVVIASFIIPVALLYEVIENALGGAVGLVSLIGLFVFYFISYFIIIFFNVAILHCANIRFSGGAPKFKDGIQAGMDNIMHIAQWAALSGTIGVILAQIEDKLGALVGGLIRKIVGGAWTIITYFAVPVMIFEKINPWESIKRSKDIIFKTWGEGLAAYIGFGWAGSLLALIGMLPLFAGIFCFTISPILGGIGVAVAVLYWIALSVVFAAMKQIFRAALYIYATTGEVPSVFTESNVTDAFRRKEGKKFI